jgi:two-component system CheB/CheR fusion protein
MSARSKRGKRAGVKPGPAPVSEDARDEGMREPEAPVAEPESGGDEGRAQTGAVITEARPAEETLRENELPPKALPDVPERRAGELDAVVEGQLKELRDAKQRLQSLLENSPLALIEWSSVDYRIVQWSDAASKVFGWTAEETIGKRIDELNWIHPADRPLVDQAVAELLSGHCPRNAHKNRNVCKDGSVIFCEWYNSTLPAPSGGFSVLSLVLDATERKRTEASRRAAELQLAEVDQRKNEFLAALAHELKTPLAPIKNSLYVLGHATLGNEPARRAQSVIERQVARLARLASDLLDVTRIARNRIKLQCQLLELNGLVRDTIEDQRSLFDATEVHLEFHPAPRPVLVNADWNRLAQVMVNLLRNAAKFTGRGGATLVTVHAEKAEKLAVVQVVDTGVGMAPEMVACLFQSFSQADSALDRGRGGLGLGLALIKGLVELHGGNVTACSAGLGHGTEFTVQLPLLMEEAAASQVNSESAAKVRRRVLVIEDDIEAADSLRDVLAGGELEVEVAYNGPEGIAKAREFSPEIVLCDIGLSGMDGFEVARAFKADESLKDILLVALSDYALPEDLLRVSQAGFAHHMAKPASLEKLQEILAAPPAPGAPGKES